MPSLAIDGSTPAVATASPGPTVTNGSSFTPPDGALLLIGWAGNAGAGASPSVPTITDDLGVSLAYTLLDHQVHNDSPNVSGQAAMWWAHVPSGAAMKISVTNQAGVGFQHCAMQVWVITGADPYNPIGAHGKSGSASASAIAQNYTAQATSGQGFISVCDWDAVGTQTAGTGCTMDAAGSIPSQISYGFGRRTTADDSNGSNNTLNVTLPSTSTNLPWCYAEVVPQVITPTLEDPPPFIASYPPGFGAPNGLPLAWQGAVDGPAQPFALTVTATEGGSVFNGIDLLVKVLTGAAATQNGASNSTTTVTTPSLSITPSATGSWVYGVLTNATNQQPWVANGSTTFAVNQVDTTNNAVYGLYRSTATTTGGSPVTLGASSPNTVTSGGLAQAEILAAGTLAEDPSGPPAVFVAGAHTATTPMFVPPAGSLLVALVSADGDVGAATMTVTGGGLVWTEVVKANGTGDGYAGVWIAQVPGGTVAAPAIVLQPQRRRPAVGYLRGRPAATRPVPDQVILIPPAYVPAATDPRPKLYAARRRPVTSVPPEQPGVLQALRVRLRLPRLGRGRTVTPVPAQAAPVFGPLALRARIGAMFGRRRAVPPALQQPPVLAATRARVKPRRPTPGRGTTVVPAQVVVTPPAYPPGSVHPRMRGARLSRGRTATVVPPQITVTPPAYVPQPVRSRVRGARPTRPRFTPPVPAQATPPLLTRIRLRIAALLRPKPRRVPPSQVILIVPGYPPQATRARQVLFARRRQRAGVDVAAFAGVRMCTIRRPSTGITARPSSGTTVYGLATTARPNTGVTVRPDSGTTEDPC